MATYLLNFQAQFAERVESGEKRQTIRQFRRDGKRLRPGDTVKLYTGLRTRNTRLLRTTTVESVSRIRMHVDESVIEIDGARLTTGEAHGFAQLDGFESAAEMFRWFVDQYGADFDGYCVRWRVDLND